MNRQQSKQENTNLVFLELKQNSYTAVECAVDAAYCEGYNAVLDAAEKVLSSEDYWKIVNYLNEHGN